MYSPKTKTSIHFCKLYAEQSSSKQPVKITHCLTVESDFTWSLFVFNVKVKKTLCPSLASTPGRLLSSDALNQVIKLVDQLRVCPDQPDSKFIEMCEAKKGVFKNTQGEVVAYMDNQAPVIFKHTAFSRTVRTMKCKLLTNVDKCSQCQEYRNSLRKSHSRWVHRSVDEATQSSGKVNIRFLNTPEKKSRIISNKKRAVSAENEVSKQRVQISHLTEKYGERVDDSLHKDVIDTMKDFSKKIEETFPEGSFAGLFWNEQLKAASKKDSRQVRWHPLIIRWCMNLKLISSSV